MISILPQTKWEWELTAGLGVWWLSLWLWGTDPYQLMLTAGGVSLGWGWMWLNRHRKIGLQWDIDWFSHDQSWQWWWGWLGVVSLSLVASQIKPVSWLQWQGWLISLVWFWWLGGLRPVVASRRIVTTAVTLGISVLTILGVAAAAWRPLWLLRLPTLNFLLATYGHHHLAALIVLAWPIVWDWATTRGKLWWWTVAVLLVGLVISFSRLASGIVLVQVGWWCWSHRRLLTRRNRLAVGSILILLVALIGFKQLMTTITFSQKSAFLKDLCIQWWVPTGSCQASAEPRGQYWHQAEEIWQQHFWLGSGPGTFGAMARRELTSPAVQSQFTHNTWLQVLAETGLIGVLIWSGLIGGLVWRAWRATRLDPTVQPLFWAVLGSLILSWFDFDWQLSGMWFPTVALLVVLITPATPIKNKTPLFKQRLNRGVLGIALSLVVASGIVSGLVGWSIQQHQLAWWLDHWPGVAEWSDQLAQFPAGSSQLQTYVQRYALNQPDLVYASLNATQSQTERWYWQEQLWRIDPWRYWETNPFQTVVETQNQPATQVLMDRLTDWLATKPSYWRVDTNQRFAANLVQIARQAVQRGDMTQLVQAVQLAQRLEPWALNNQPPIITLTDSVDRRGVLAAMATIDQAHYGDQLGLYRGVYINLISQEATQLETEQQRLTAPDETASLVTEIETLGQQTLRLLPDSASRPPALAHRLATLLLTAGELRLGSKTYLTATDYRLAQIMEPWVLNGRLWWFEPKSLQQYDPEEILQFADQWTEVTGEKSGYKPVVWQKFYQYALQLAIQRGDSDRQTKYRQRLNQIQTQL